MAAPVMPWFSAEKPPTLRLRLRWTMVLVLAAFGGAGLAAAADKPVNPVQRPELTYRADQAAQPWVEQLRRDLDLVATQGAQLSSDGGDLLGSLSVLDRDSANAALGRGEATSAGIATLSAGLHDTITRADEQIERWRLGLTWLGVLQQIDAAITATDELPADWTAIAATGRTVVGLVDALDAHDDAVFQGTTLGRETRWGDAIALISGTAADALANARAARDTLASAGSPVDALDDLLGRMGAYDAALISLYQYLAGGGAQSGAQFDTLQAQVDTTQAALPADNAELVVIAGDAAGLPIADQLLAMETAHGKINDALEAITDAKSGGEPTDAP